jgi:hypothetical protein
VKSCVRDDGPGPTRRRSPRTRTTATTSAREAGRIRVAALPRFAHCASPVVVLRCANASSSAYAMPRCPPSGMALVCRPQRKQSRRPPRAALPCRSRSAMSGGAAVRSGAVRSVAEPSRPPPSRLVICGAVDEPPSRANAADSARLDRRERGGIAQLERVAARRHAEHASVLAPDRRGAVVADSEAGAGDVRWLGKEPCPRFVQARPRVRTAARSSSRSNASNVWSTVYGRIELDGAARDLDSGGVRERRAAAKHAAGRPSGGEDTLYSLAGQMVTARPCAERRRELP